MLHTDQSAAKSPRIGHVFYGWRLVGIAAVAMALMSAPIFHGLGIFFVALEREFKWSRTVLSVAFSLTRAEGALLGPLEGFLIDRLGPRRMILIGFIIMGAGFIAFSLVQGVVSFYAAFILIYLGAGLGGFLPFLAAINNWFVRKRTTAMGINMAGNNMGGVLVPVLAFAITRLGWRVTALGLGLVTLAAAFPLYMLVRNRPEEYGLYPDGDPPRDPSESQAIEPQEPIRNDTDFTLRQAIRTQAFWVIAMAHGCAAGSSAVVAVHIIPALTDMKLSLEMAGTVVAVYTFTGVLFQLAGGFLGDRFPKPLAIAAFITIQATSMLVAATIHTLPGAFLFAILYGAGFGGRLPLLMSIRGEYFGRKSFATIMGFSQFPINIAMMGTPIMAGYLFDTTGSYNSTFMGLAVLNFVGAAIILLSRRPRLPSSRLLMEVA